MYCKNCGKEINENSFFCPFCGERVKDSNDNIETISEENDFSDIKNNDIIDNNQNVNIQPETNNFNSIQTNEFNNINSNNNIGNNINENIISDNQNNINENNNYQNVNNTEFLNNNAEVSEVSNTQNNSFSYQQPVANVINNSQPIQMNQNLNNMKANSNDSKKNILFLIAVIVLVLIIIGLGLFIGYKLVSGTKETVVQNEKTNTEETETVKKVKQAITFNLDGYTFKLPSGYKYSLTDGVHFVMDDKREVVLEFENVFKLSFVECAASAEETKATLIKQGFNVASYEQKNVNGMYFLVFKIIEENKEIYMYAAKLDEYNIVKGYFIMSSYSTVDEALEKIGVIISSATGANSNETTTFSKSLPKINENNLFESKLKK